MIRTFLIADLRGYTTLSDAHGDQAAADVAERFLAIARECVDGAFGDGRRGPRGRGAGGLRLGEGGAPRGARDPGGRRRANRTERQMLGVGIGLDAGEAVPVGDGYPRAGA